MYSIEWSRIFKRNPQNSLKEEGGDPATVGKTYRLKRVSSVVWALGFTSLLTDVSSEMVASILPIYLVTFLGMSPMAFGLVDGLHQGAAALVRVIGGVFADRWKRHKQIAALGYGLSAACRLLLLFAGNAWSAVTGIIALDRVGKGIRTAPRDALISHNSDRLGLATAFGVHRALDAFGAMLGPVMAFAILYLMPGAFDVLFVISFGVAVIGLAVILLFVRSTGQSHGEESGPRASFTAALRLWTRPLFRAQVLAGTVLGLATISDNFLYLMLQRKLDLPVTAFPLLYVGTSLSTALFAMPCGQLADRLGRGGVFLGGYVILAGVYSFVLAVPNNGSWWLMTLPIILLGMYYAATDGVLTAMAASTLPASQVGSGLSLLATGVNVARLLASVGFGWAWSHFGFGQAIGFYLAALVIAVLFAALVLLQNRRADTLC